MKVREVTPGQFLIEADQSEVQTIRWLASFAITLRKTVLEGTFMGKISKIHKKLENI